MSKKLASLFRRKNHKADSHGTTTADEDITFHPVLDPPKAPTLLSTKQPATANNCRHASNALEDKLREGLQNKEKRTRHPDTVASYNSDNHNNSEERNQRGIVNDEETHHVAAIPQSGVSIMKPPTGTGIAGGRDVSISTEYSDPFDMLKGNKGGQVKQSADGYREPYSLDQTLEDGMLRHQKSPGNYHDPWESSNGRMEYDDPWNSNIDATLVKSLQAPMPGVPRSGRKQETVLMNESQSSATSSSSASPNPANRGLSHAKHSKNSRTTTRIDERLILAKDPPTNYCEPWTHHQVRNHFDNRLVKAEPSLEELKIISRSTTSTNSSGRETPNDSSPYLQKHLILDQPAMPQVQFPHLVHPNWTKSRSLDIHKGGCNTMVMSYSKDSSFRRSMSDDNLITAAASHVASTSTSNPQLNGSDIYEEPWDRSSSAGRVHHPMSTLFPSPRTDDSVEEDHIVLNVQSMQRFQERKLELHPSEAINARDIDPFLPLHNQSWYHGDITREQAECRLYSHPNGSFLVRKSKTSKGGYSLSVQSSKGCVHILLKCTRDNNWILGEFSAPFLSASEMVAHYRRHQLRISDTESLVLSNPIESGIL